MAYIIRIGPILRSGRLDPSPHIDLPKTTFAELPLEDIHR